MLAGTIAAAPVSFFTFTFPVASQILWPMLLAMLWLTLNVGAIYIFNQIADKDNDNYNDKLFFISHGEMTVEAAWIEGIALTLVSLTGAWFISMDFFVMILASTLVGVCYNFLGFMNRPLPALLMNFSGGVISFLAGAAATSSLSSSFIPLPLSQRFISLRLTSLIFSSLAYGFAWAAVYLLVTLPDAEGDRKFGKMTFAVRYGAKATLIAALTSDAVSLVIAILSRDVIIGVAAFVSLPLFWQVVRAESSKEVFSPVKFSMLFLALMVCLYLPLFLLLLVLTFLACKIYYRARFGLDYPNFQRR